MNNFETNSRTDTVLSGGLIAIGILWVALAAVQARPAPDAPTAGYFAVSAGSAHAGATAAAHGDAIPAAAERIGGAKLA
jgi:hypothetical protein